MGFEVGNVRVYQLFENPLSASHTKLTTFIQESTRGLTDSHCVLSSCDMVSMLFAVPAWVYRMVAFCATSSKYGGHYLEIRRNSAESQW